MNKKMKSPLSLGFGVLMMALLGSTSSVQGAEGTLTSGLQESAQREDDRMFEELRSACVQVVGNPALFLKKSTFGLFLGYSFGGTGSIGIFDCRDASAVGTFLKGVFANEPVISAQELAEKIKQK